MIVRKSRQQSLALSYPLVFRAPNDSPARKIVYKNVELHLNVFTVWDHVGVQSVRGRSVDVQAVWKFHAM